MAQKPIARRPVNPGPSPEALAAFYQKRSEALRHNTTTTEDEAMRQQQAKQNQSPVQQEQLSWFQRLYQALGGQLH